MKHKTLFLMRAFRVGATLLALCGLPFAAGAETIAEHANLTYTGPGTCLGSSCHTNDAHDVFGSSHYQWQGPDPYMLNSPNANKSKLSDVGMRISGGVNSYCGNILGNWGCSSCHIGRGAKPSTTVSQAQLENIDCLTCHQKEYKRKRDANGMMVPDTANMTISMDQAVRTVHEPERANCLQCHAKAGGGDAVKRGDLAMATANTLDSHYDAHMATTGENLQCQDCHVTQNHRIAGKGTDLRTTDLDTNMGCGNSGCHNSTPHDTSSLNRHTTKVACQTCHIPVYAKNAADTAATEATETHRTWRTPEWSTVNNRWDPEPTLANNLMPKYKFWNGYSMAYLLGDTAKIDPVTGAYPTSRPAGARTDANAKLYPFKYKTSDYPMRTASQQLIALDTKVYFPTGDPDAAALSGLQNMISMGYPFAATDAISWVTTDTYQLLNHQVSPEDDALQCTQCHMNKSRMDLQGQLGYAPSKPNSTCSSGCHSASKASGWTRGSYSKFTSYHDKHVRDKGYNCSKCHGFSK